MAQNGLRRLSAVLVFQKKYANRTGVKVAVAEKKEN
jgi:hypothetical protein